MPKDFALTGGWMGWFGGAWSKPLGRCSRKRHRARHSGGPAQATASKQDCLVKALRTGGQPGGRAGNLLPLELS